MEWGASHCNRLLTVCMEFCVAFPSCTLYKPSLHSLKKNFHYLLPVEDSKITYIKVFYFLKLFPCNRHAAFYEFV
jgi:hypothetical protein